MVIVVRIADRLAARAEVHRLYVDLALLLSLVDDPIEMASQLTKKDMKRLRRRSEMGDADQRAWLGLSADEADRGRAALRLLVGGIA